MNLTCYRVHDDAPELIPARARRAWLDTMASRLDYGSMPLAMANATGWELICPFAISVAWNGGEEPGDPVITPDDFAGRRLPNPCMAMAC
jgi:hypothetical protein